MYGGIKTLKHNVRTTLPLAYHWCKNFTQTSKTRQVKRTQIVATASFTIRDLAFQTAKNGMQRNVARKNVRFKTGTVARKFAIGALHLRRGLHILKI